MSIAHQLTLFTEEVRTKNWCIPPETGALLALLARLKSAKRILEIGTSIGYSGLWWLSALVDTQGTLETIDASVERQAIAKTHFEAVEVLHLVTFHTGEALDCLSTLQLQTYDVMFLDAHKADYLNYFEHAQTLLKPGGLLVADNTTSHRSAMSDFINAIQTSTWHYTELSTLGSGLLLAIKP